jgi:hypothetical protein
VHLHVWICTFEFSVYLHYEEDSCNLAFNQNTRSEFLHQTILYVILEAMTSSGNELWHWRVRDIKVIGTELHIQSPRANLKL